MSLSPTEKKRRAAEAALAYVEAGMVLGVGTGSTVAQLIEALKDRKIQLEGAVSSSRQTSEALRAARIPELTPEIHNAIAGFLALTPCVLWLVNQEDITCEPYQQNLPGTTAEYPNWSRKMRWSLQDLVELEEARGSVGMVRHWIERTGRAVSE